MARNQFSNITLQVSELLLDSNNPRLRNAMDQRECIEKLLRKEGNFKNLARDIAKNGLSIEPVVVSQNDDGRWVVRDGNRRVAALQLLLEPERCPTSDVRRYISNLAKQYTHNIPKTIECPACNDEGIVLNYLELRHTGTNDGVGQDSWSAFMQAIFDLRNGYDTQYKRAAQLVLWAEASGIRFDDDFPISTLERMLSRDTLTLMELTTDASGGPIPATDNGHRIVEQILTDIATKTKQVNDLFRPDQQIKYVHDVRTRLGLPETPPNPPPASIRYFMPTISTTRPGRRRNAPTWDRPSLFPKKRPGFEIQDDSYPKEHNIVYELTRIDARQTPMAVAVLFRVLLELSVRHYFDMHHLPPRDGDSLGRKIRAAMNHMKDRGLISHEQEQIILAKTAENDSLPSIRTIQAYVHSPNFHPTAQILHCLWDEIGFFVVGCWT